MQTEAYLGLGSNLGDRRRRLREALDAIRALATDLRVSSLYETQPQGFSDQPPFLNAVCRVWTRLDPFELLDEIRRIQASGARPAFVNGPRDIDVDLLLYGKAVIGLPHLVVPHPRMCDREFVLAPLTEIAPGLVHPVRKRTAADLFASLPSRGTVRLAGSLAATPRATPLPVIPNVAQRSEESKAPLLAATP